MSTSEQAVATTQPRRRHLVWALFKYLLIPTLLLIGAWGVLWDRSLQTDRELDRLLENPPNQTTEGTPFEAEIDRFLPAIAKRLATQRPLRYEMTERLPRTFSQWLATSLPPKLRTTFFRSPAEHLASQEQCLELLAELPVEYGPRVMPILVSGLGHSAPQIQDRAIRLLSQFHSDAAPATPQLIPFLEASTAQTRTAAAKTLGRIGPGAKLALPAIINAFQDESEMTRTSAVVAYGRITDRQSTAPTPLLETLDDDSPWVRAAGAKSIRQSEARDPETIKKLIAALDDPDALVRRNSALALGAIGEAAAPAIDRLAQALWDGQREVRISAAEALGGIGPPAERAIPQMLDALSNEFASMGAPVQQAIQKIAPGKVPDLWER